MGLRSFLGLDVKKLLINNLMSSYFTYCHAIWFGFQQKIFDVFSFLCNNCSSILKESLSRFGNQSKESKSSLHGDLQHSPPIEIFNTLSMEIFNALAPWRCWALSPYGDLQHTLPREIFNSLPLRRLSAPLTSQCKFHGRNIFLENVPQNSLRDMQI